MIINLLDEIWNGLPNEVHSLMGFNKAAIIDKMLAVALTPEMLVLWKLCLKLASKWMENYTQPCAEEEERCIKKVHEDIAWMEVNIL